MKMEESIILYEHGCPKCRILKMKLDQKGVQYQNITDVELMKAKGFQEAPKLEVNGVVMSFTDAMKWVGER
jgi:glutaredoxin